MPQDIENTIQNLLSAPDTSYWLKQSITAALARDCVDAANDAELLADLLVKRSKAIAGSF